MFAYLPFVSLGQAILLVLIVILVPFKSYSTYVSLNRLLAMRPQGTAGLESTRKVVPSALKVVLVKPISAFVMTGSHSSRLE